MSLFGFLRLVTSRRVIEPPMPVAEASDRIAVWLARPNVELLLASARHVSTTLDLMATVGTGGTLTTDAQLAAYAIDRDAELHSHDRDFGRFPGLRWVDPLALA